jgi:hypothetical protein
VIKHGNIAKALEAEGLLPKECRNVELHLHNDALVELRYSIGVMPEDYAKLSRAFAAMAKGASLEQCACYDPINIINGMKCALHQ